MQNLIAFFLLFSYSSIFGFVLSCSSQINEVNITLSENTVVINIPSSNTEFKDSIDLGVSYNHEKIIISESHLIVLIKTFNNVEYDYVYSIEFINNDSIHVEKYEGGIIRVLNNGSFFQINLLSKHRDYWESYYFNDFKMLKNNNPSSFIKLKDDIFTTKEGDKNLINSINQESLYLADEDYIRDYWKNYELHYGKNK